ncbi:MAG: glycosyl transferase [Planctomycetota bacterium]|nr:MAG: glycosyl transferase [Planctomycetota bacterium]
MPVVRTVVHVDPERGFSGGESQVFLLMEGLRARHGLRSILYGQPGSRPVEEAIKRGFVARAFPMRNDADVMAIVRGTNHLRADKPDLVHLHTGRANWLGGWAARRAGIPALSTRRMDRTLKVGWATRTTYSKLVRRVVAISPAVQRVLHEAGVPPAMTSVIWSSVDVNALRPVRSRDKIRAELGIPDGELLLLGVAQLTHRKGYDLLLDALAALPSHELPPWRLLLAGEGPALAELSQQATRLALDERVRFLGARDDVPDLHAAADVFLMPSRSEGLGIASLEAMAAGTPVLAAQVGGLAEAVVHEETGLLVPPEDVPALSAALQRLLRDDDLRARLAAAGPRRIAETFSAETMVDSYVALYDDILKESRA